MGAGVGVGSCEMASESHKIVLVCEAHVLLARLAFVLQDRDGGGGGAVSCETGAGLYCKTQRGS